MPLLSCTGATQARAFRVRFLPIRTEERPCDCAESLMKKVFIRFYAQLNDFLPTEMRRQTITYNIDVIGSVKDRMEAIGVPHTEVDFILVNSQPVDFTYRLQEGDRVSVFPRFRSIDIRPLKHLRPAEPGKKRFVADGHLGRLAAYLRMLGFDTLYRSSYHDQEVARICSSENRILLTRDRGLLKRNEVRYAYYPRATKPAQQLAEVIREFDLVPAIAPFGRCMHCNALLRATEKNSIRHRLLPQTAKYFEEFYACPDCQRVYWKGSHYRRMKRFIESLVPSAGRSLFWADDADLERDSVCRSGR